jgi:hypothetical protein
MAQRQICARSNVHADSEDFASPGRGFLVPIGGSGFWKAMVLWLAGRVARCAARDGIEMAVGRKETDPGSFPRWSTPAAATMDGAPVRSARSLMPDAE